MCPERICFWITFTALGLDWEGQMLTKGRGAGGVGIKPGLRSVMLHGDPPEASSEGVPLFLQERNFFLQNSGNTPVSCNQ